MFVCAGIEVEGNCNAKFGINNTNHVLIGKDFASEDNISLNETGKLTVYGDLYCEKSIECTNIDVYGSIYCKGSINAINIYCRGIFLCEGDCNANNALFEKMYEIKGQNNIKHLSKTEETKKRNSGKRVS